MNVCLGVLGKGEIKQVRQLDIAEYEKCQAAIKQLDTFANYRERYTILMENFRDYENTMDRFLEKFTADPRLTLQRAELMILEAKRLLLNLLSSIRTYLDHTDRDFIHRYGEDSLKHQRYKESRSKEYDNFFHIDSLISCEIALNTE